MLGLLKKKGEKEKKVQMDWRCAGKDKEEEEEEQVRGLYCGIYDLWLRGRHFAISSTIVSLQFSVESLKFQRQICHFQGLR